MARTSNAIGYNRTKKQHYKRANFSGPAEKGVYAENYYNKNRRRIDKIIDAYKKKYPTNASNKLIFVDEMVYGGKNWGSARQAKEAIERKLVKLQGGDTDWYDAKHGANRSIFGDLRKMNNKKPVYVDYQFGDKDTDGFTVDGYYETSDPDIVIANITYFPTNDSPYELWEYQHKDEIGL